MRLEEFFKKLLGIGAKVHFEFSGVFTASAKSKRAGKRLSLRHIFFVWPERVKAIIFQQSVEIGQLGRDKLVANFVETFFWSAVERKFYIWRQS